MNNEEEVNEEEAIEEDISSPTEFSDMTVSEQRDLIRQLMTKATFDRRTNIALNRILYKNEILDRYGIGSSPIRNFVKGMVLGTQAEERDKLIKHQIRNEYLKSGREIITIISIIVTVISIVLALRGSF